MAPQGERSTASKKKHSRGRDAPVDSASYTLAEWEHARGEWWLRERRDDALCADRRRRRREHALQLTQQLELLAAVHAAVEMRRERRELAAREAVVQQRWQLIPVLRVHAIIHRETPSRRASRCDSARGRRLRWCPLRLLFPCTTSP